PPPVARSGSSGAASTPPGGRASPGGGGAGCPARSCSTRRLPGPPSASPAPSACPRPAASELARHRGRPQERCADDGARTGAEAAPFPASPPGPSPPVGQRARPCYHRPMRRIGILTSGGDAPGMNAAIRAAVRHALGKGLEVIGIRRGYAGLLAGEMRALTRAEVANIIQRGGTVLGTSRCEEFLDAKGRARAAAVLQGAGIEGLIVVGGEGTFHGATLLAAEQGVCVAGVPGTIDNDVYGTDFTIGFDTAINTALEAIDRIRDTAASHERLFLVEVMGRTSGDIALGVGVAGGAEDVLSPEIPTDL